MQNRIESDQPSRADDGGGEVVNSLKMLTRSFVANLQASIVAEPCEGAFDDIPEFAEAAAVVLVVDLGGSL